MLTISGPGPSFSKLGRAADPKETMSYRTEEAISANIAPAQTAQLLYDLSDGIDLLLVIGR